jgi:hypothetical protein
MYTCYESKLKMMSEIVIHGMLDEIGWDFKKFNGKANI